MRKTYINSTNPKEFIPTAEGECEIGYWIGKPYWGQGLIPEATNELIRHCFEELNIHLIWCGYYEGNEKSKRVQEKCGFTYHHTNYDVPCVSLGDIRTEHITCLTKEVWQKKHRYKDLKQKLIKELHLTLKSGTSDLRKSWFNVGEYKKLPNEIGGKEIASPENAAQDNIKNKFMPI